MPKKRPPIKYEVVLSKEASEFLQDGIIKTFLVDGNVLPCVSIATDDPFYLEAVLQPTVSRILRDKTVTLLIPHTFVLYVFSARYDKTLGFVRRELADEKDGAANP
jgi:hypothetical protein